VCATGWRCRMSKKQDPRVLVLLAHPDKGAVIIDGIRYESLQAAAQFLEVPWRDFERKILQRKIVVVVPGK